MHLCHSSHLAVFLALLINLFIFIFVFCFVGFDTEELLSEDTLQSLQEGELFVFVTR